MAIKIGELLIRLGADISALKRDMAAASAEVSRATRQMQSAANAARTALGAIGIGLSIGAVVSQIRASVDELAALDDASEATGSSVEKVSAALNTLRANDAGGLPELLDITSRLGRAFQNVDKDTSKAGEAFKRLGLNVDELKRGGRIEAAVAIAQALEKYEDNGQKAILVDAALGRGASQLIPRLKELAKTTDSAATASGESAAEAERAAKAMATFQTHVINFRNDLVSYVLPSFNDFVAKLRAFAQIGSAPMDIVAAAFGSDEAVEAKIKEREDKIADLRRKQDKAAADYAATQGNDRAISLRRNAQTRLDGINAELATEGARLDQLRALVQRRKELQASASSGGAAVKPTISAAGLTGDDDRDKRKTTEAERLLESLRKQLITSRDLTAEQQAAAQLAEIRGEVVPRALEQEILLTAVLIDKERERADVRKKAEADAAEALRAQREYQRAEDDADEALRKEAAAIRDMIDPTAALYRELDRVRLLAATGFLPPDVANGRSAQLLSQIDGVLQGVAGAAQDAGNAVQDMLAPIESSLERIVFEGGKARDVLSSLAEDMGKLIFRQQITAPLAALVTGQWNDAKMGGTMLGMIGRMFGFRADGGPVWSGQPVVTGEKGAEVFVPPSDGYIVPNAALRSMQSMPAGQRTLALTVNYTARSGSPAEAQRAAALIKADVRRALAEDEARGAR